MKKLMILVLSVAMIGVCSVAQAQQQDTTSTGYRSQPNEEQEEKTEQQSEQTTDQELEEARDDMQDFLKHSSDKAKLLETKVGPNGEPVYLDEDGNYYYINENGKKKKIKESKLRDKPDNE